MQDFDYLIIGSGPAGMMAAQTLLERGKHVTVVDAGIAGPEFDPLPERTFAEIHSADKEQWKYFLGEQFECLQLGGIRTAPHLSVRRKHLGSGTAEWMPSRGAIQPLESLSSGGLGQAWGLGSFIYNTTELNSCGLPAEEMHPAYQEIINRIGVSAGNDILREKVMPGMSGIQQPLRSDALGSALLRRYQRKSAGLQKQGIFMGSPSLAMLTESKDGRPALLYDELEFYHDNGSAYRPSITLGTLSGNPRFTHLKGLAAVSFLEQEGKTMVQAISRIDNESITLRTNTLILAMGALSTARLVMRSLHIESLPFLCNPYYYLASISPAFLGTVKEQRRSALAQAMMLVESPEKGGRDVIVSLYTYGSLLQYRLIAEVPLLPFREALRIVRFSSPALLIAGIHHPEFPDPAKRLKLIASDESRTGDLLHIDYALKNAQLQEIALMNSRVKKALWKLGVLPLKLVDPGMGASIHYGGTLPFTSAESRGFQNKNGLLLNTASVYIVDSSGFNYLPAKGITLSIMANAHRVAKQIP